GPLGSARAVGGGNGVGNERRAGLFRGRRVRTVAARAAHRGATGRAGAALRWTSILPGAVPPAVVGGPRGRGGPGRSLRPVRARAGGEANAPENDGLRGGGKHRDARLVALHADRGRELEILESRGLGEAVHEQDDARVDRANDRGAVRHVLPV